MLFSTTVPGGQVWRFRDGCVLAHHNTSVKRGQELGVDRWDLADFTDRGGDFRAGATCGAGAG
jgi:hypothetical protein